MGTNKEKIMTYYAALDVSLRSVCLCIVDAEGSYCFEHSAGFTAPSTSDLGLLYRESRIPRVIANR